jgi:hypothetical protein
MHLMAQPGVAGDWLSDPRLTDQGLTSRVLVTAPDSTAGTRFWREWKGNGELAAYDRRIFDLVGRPLAIDQAGGGVRPRVVSMSAAARQAWIDFYNWCEGRIQSGGEFEPIISLANKLAEHAARLAAVLTMVADPDAGAIEAEAVEHGIALARHYASEALRLFQGGTADPDLQLAEKALAWIKGRRGALFSLPDLYRLGPPAIRDKATATKVIGLLADHGSIEQVAGGAEVEGRWRREVWRLVSED